MAEEAAAGAGDESAGSISRVQEEQKTGVEAGDGDVGEGVGIGLGPPVGKAHLGPTLRL